MRGALAILLCALALAGCGSDDGSGAAASNVPAAAGAERGVPRALAQLESQHGQLLDGGADAFESRLAELKGHPVVVNKWASWCGPCRAEFPFFQKQAAESGGDVAFLGVNSSDNDGDAAQFLEQFPVPYPSYRDPELEVAKVFNGVAAFPTTAFYDSSGKLTYVKQGGYASEQQLAEDIQRYAR